MININHDNSNPEHQTRKDNLKLFNALINNKIYEIQLITKLINIDQVQDLINNFNKFSIQTMNESNDIIQNIDKLSKEEIDQKIKDLKTNFNENLTNLNNQLINRYQMHKKKFGLKSEKQ